MKSYTGPKKCVEEIEPRRKWMHSGLLSRIVHLQTWALRETHLPGRTKDGSRNGEVSVRSSLCQHAGLQLFSALTVRHLPLVGSDHRPILLSLQANARSSSTHRGRPFRFESFWICKEECQMIVQESWSGQEEIAGWEEWMPRVENCRDNLRGWSSDPQFNVKVRISQVKQRMSVLASGRQTPEHKTEHAILSLELEKLYADQSDFWQQRSKTHWMKEGIATRLFSMLRLPRELRLTRWRG